MLPIITAGCWFALTNLPELTNLTEYLKRAKVFGEILPWNNAALYHSINACNDTGYILHVRAREQYAGSRPSPRCVRLGRCDRDGESALRIADYVGAMEKKKYETQRTSEDK